MRGKSKNPIVGIGFWFGNALTLTSGFVESLNAIGPIPKG